MRFWGSRDEWRDLWLYLRRAVLDFVIFAMLLAVELPFIPSQWPAVAITVLALAEFAVVTFLIRPRVQRWLGWA